MIVYVQSKDDIEQIRSLFREYERYLNVDLCFQKFEEELANLPGEYAPPNGVLLLAKEGIKAVGCGALRKLGGGGCEMKRLYVTPQFQGKGLGRQLAHSLIEDAVRLGYDWMYLDTLERLKAANALYESLGFERTISYYPNPLPDVVYWKLNLARL